ncbi:Ger(x)C family spore germination protein [Cohnella cholangitidis]|uniref:Ger(X)C family spore germination protein n=1 Tax=Cohnella cholangitidis TaxID=2598458 RepID=A0A7G5C5W6_9BACL|nr:Ger(x)C family spore germination protein [Cohnella cholangitidis]QMV44600.1 Ger(x)C family spore germination protein [Cohnella cholangitidis]
MKRIKLVRTLLAVCLIASLLTGCWDFKNIDRMNYLTTLGIDYDKNQFVVYLQSTDFSAIAKREGTPSASKQTQVIGIGKGISIGDALFQLYETEQIPIYYGHIKTLVLSKKALQKIGLVDLTDLVNRYREIRYNLWVFGTEEPMDKFLFNHPYFNLSAYDSILMKPLETYKQSSFIKPIYLNRFLADFYEKGKTAMIPILSTDKSNWKEGGKTLRELKMSGMYFFGKEKWSGELDTERLQGKQYLDKNMRRAPLILLENNKPIITFVVHTQKIKVRYSIDNGKLSYKIEVKLKAFLDEMLENMSQDEMRARIMEHIEKNIRLTYDSGREFNADVLNLGYPIYKYHHSVWKKYIRDVEDVPDIQSIKFDLQIIHSGKYKGKIHRR